MNPNFKKIRSRANINEWTLQFLFFLLAFLKFMFVKELVGCLHKEVTHGPVEKGGGNDKAGVRIVAIEKSGNKLIILTKVQLSLCLIMNAFWF